MVLAVVTLLSLAAEVSADLAWPSQTEIPKHVSLQPGGRVLARTSDTFLGVSLDFWRPDDPRYGKQWGNASALRIPLTPRLSQLARTLAPAVIRIGGSPQDSLVYQPLGGECPAGTPAPNNYYCSQVQPLVYDCLTTSRWRELTDFMADAGLKLVLGLNGCLGRPARNESVDIAALSRFLNDTATQGLKVYGFELGNELDGTYSGSSGVDPEQVGRDLGKLSEVVAQLWPEVASRPKLLGPDIAAFTGGTALPSYFEDALSTAPAGVLHGLTFHQYPYCSSPDNDAGTVLSLSCLSKLTKAADAFSALAANHSIEAWAGEGANCWCGGLKGVTDSFLDLFYYGFQLSEMATRGVSTVVRQTLVGGDYSLLDRDTLEPNPSYWLAALWRRLMGTASIEFSSTSEDSQLHVSMHCSHHKDGKAVAFVMNFGSVGSYSVDLAGYSGDLLVHLLSADGVASREVKLNGHVLRANADGSPPALEPQLVPSPFVLPPASIAFIQAADAGATTAPCGEVKVGLALV